MALLLDEYKQAIKDVLDGRSKEAPRPSELPDTEDRLATFYAAAAAELLTEAKIPEAVPPVLYAHDNGTGLDINAEAVNDAIVAGRYVVVVFGNGAYEPVTSFDYDPDSTSYLTVGYGDDAISYSAYRNGNFTRAE